MIPQLLQGIHASGVAAAPVAALEEGPEHFVGEQRIGVQLLLAFAHTQQVFIEALPVVALEGAAVLQHRLGGHGLVVHLLRLLRRQLALGQADAGAKGGHQAAVFLLLHAQSLDQPLRSLAGAGAGGVVRGHPLRQQRDVSAFVAGLPALQSSLVLGQLDLDGLNRLPLRGGAQQAQEVVPAAKLCDVGHVLPCRFRPSAGHVPQQRAEQLPFAHAAADVPQVEQQLHGQLGGLDVGLLEQRDLVRRPAVAHAAGHREEVQAGVAGGTVGLGPVQGAGVVGFGLQIRKIAHILVLLSSLLTAFQPPRGRQPTPPESARGGVPPGMTRPGRACFALRAAPAAGDRRPSFALRGAGPRGHPSPRAVAIRLRRTLIVPRCLSDLCLAALPVSGRGP